MSGQPHPGPPPGGQHHRPADQGADGDQDRSGDHGKSGDGRDLWPRDFGRDGVSGLVNGDRAMRARDVSRPSHADDVAAESVLADLVARIEGRPRTGSRAQTAKTAGSTSRPVPQPPPQGGDS